MCLKQTYLKKEDYYGQQSLSLSSDVRQKDTKV